MASSSSSSSSSRSSSSSSVSSSSSSVSSSSRSSSSSSRSSSSRSSSCSSSSSSCRSSSSSSSSSTEINLTVATEPFGYIITAGLTTSIGRATVKDFIYVPNANNNTYTISDDVGNVVFQDKGAVAGTAYHKHFGDYGSQFAPLTVTFTDPLDILYIHLTRVR